VRPDAARIEARMTRASDRRLRLSHDPGMYSDCTSERELGDANSSDYPRRDAALAQC
jgi:hypothetical protein